MSESDNRILAVLEEMRDILRQQADRVTATLQAFADINRESNRKYLEALDASHKADQKSQTAYQEAQAAYKKQVESRISRFLESKPWQATVFVISLAIIAACLVVNLVLRLIRY